MMINTSNSVYSLKAQQLEKMVKNDVNYKVTIIQETSFSMKYRVFIDAKEKRYELHTQKSIPKVFSSLDTFYKFSQKIGINVALIQVAHIKDGVIPK